MKDTNEHPDRRDTWDKLWAKRQEAAVHFLGILPFKSPAMFKYMEAIHSFSLRRMTVLLATGD